MTEKEKMLTQQKYSPMDKELSDLREQARHILHKFNATRPTEKKLRRKLITELFKAPSVSTWIEPPFHCDYGENISIGEKVFFNFDCIILDTAQVTIGDRVLLGPKVQVYCAHHPLDAKERATFIETALPVTIGDDVWIGGGAIICPGVTIGDRSVIGAGSVVTKDIPSDVVAVGNPCKVIKQL